MAKPKPSVVAGNAKLGPAIYSWSIPAGKEYSCPQETGVCRVRCYAMRGHYYQSNVIAAHQHNWAMANSPEFAEWMTAALYINYVRVMRIHVAGDFFNSGYISQWQTIISRRRQTRFFAYTRSWQDDEMLPGLIRLSQLPNMSLWWSIDRATGPAPLVRGIRRAYLAINDVDAASAPNDCDLVFRDRPRSKMKKANGIFVCPPENGVTTKVKITCTACGFCWRTERKSTWERSLSKYIAGNTDDIEILAPSKLSQPVAQNREKLRRKTKNVSVESQT